MKFKIAIDWLVKKQEEVIQEVDLNEKQVRAIVDDFVNQKTYSERQKWLDSVVG